MRFKDYLQEGVTFNFDQFKKDCSYYLHLMHQKKGFLYHGDKSASSDWTIRNFIARTGPRDSPTALHDEVNAWMKDKFGYPYRNGLFVTGDPTTSSVYGVNTVIVPIGNFEWLCNIENSDLMDMQGLYLEVFAKLRKSEPDLDFVERKKKAEKLTLAEVKKKGWKHNEDLDKCIASKNEIMIKCSKFYAFKTDGDTYLDIISKLNDESTWK